MKLAALALALGLASPAFAAAPLSIDFEKSWSFGDEVANTYADQGVSFTNVLGLSNDPDFPAYSNAPSPLGVAFVQLDGVVNTTAYLNVGAGVTGGLSFYSAGTEAFTINAYSGLNGTGTLVGTITVAATGGYDSWKQSVLSLGGATAQSFDLSSSAGVAALDNISAVPEPTSIALMLAGGALIAARRRRA